MTVPNKVCGPTPECKECCCLSFYDVLLCCMLFEQFYKCRFILSCSYVVWNFCNQVKTCIVSHFYNVCAKENYVFSIRAFSHVSMFSQRSCGSINCFVLTNYFWHNVDCIDLQCSPVPSALWLQPTLWLRVSCPVGSRRDCICNAAYLWLLTIKKGTTQGDSSQLANSTPTTFANWATPNTASGTTPCANGARGGIGHATSTSTWRTADGPKATGASTGDYGATTTTTTAMSDATGNCGATTTATSTNSGTSATRCLQWRCGGLEFVRMMLMHSHFFTKDLSIWSW